MGVTHASSRSDSTFSDTSSVMSDPISRDGARAPTAFEGRSSSSTNSTASTPRSSQSSSSNLIRMQAHQDALDRLRRPLEVRASETKTLALAQANADAVCQSNDVQDCLHRDKLQVMSDVVQRGLRKACESYKALQMAQAAAERKT